MTYAMPCRDCSRRETLEVSTSAGAPKPQVTAAVSAKAAEMGWLLVDQGKTKFFLCPDHQGAE